VKTPEVQKHSGFSVPNWLSLGFAGFTYFTRFSFFFHCFSDKSDKFENATCCEKVVALAFLIEQKISRRRGDFLIMWLWDAGTGTLCPTEDKGVLNAKRKTAQDESGAASGKGVGGFTKRISRVR
jgi:hypothetical protein